jgi:hypothetical protein
VDLVVIPPSVPDLRDVAGFFEVIDDLCRRSLGDADGKGDIPETRRWIAGDRFEHVSVVRDEPPAVEVVCSCPRHLMGLPELSLEGLQQQGEQLGDGQRVHSRRPHLGRAVDLVPIPPAGPRLCQVARSLEVTHDVRRPPLGDSDAIGHVPQARLRVGGDAGEHATVVCDQAKGARSDSGT